MYRRVLSTGSSFAIWILLLPFLKDWQGAARKERRCSRAYRTTCSCQRPLACKRKREVAQRTTDWHSHAYPQQRPTSGFSWSILLTNVTTDPDRTGSKIEGRTMDRKRLWPIKTIRLQTGNGPTTTTKTKKVVAITGMWTIFDHAKRQSEHARTNWTTEEKERTGIQAVAELHKIGLLTGRTRRNLLHWTTTAMHELATKLSKHKVIVGRIINLLYLRPMFW